LCRNTSKKKSKQKSKEKGKEKAAASERPGGLSWENAD